MPQLGNSVQKLKLYKDNNRVWRCFVRDIALYKDNNRRLGLVVQDISHFLDETTDFTRLIQDSAVCSDENQIHTVLSKSKADSRTIRVTESIALCRLPSVHSLQIRRTCFRLTQHLPLFRFYSMEFATADRRSRRCLHYYQSKCRRMAGKLKFARRGWTVRRGL